MTDLTFIYEDSTIAEVDKTVALIASKEPLRTYLGMSEIGDECVRRLWLKYHKGFVETFEGRLYRLFDTGHIIEQRIVKDLRAAGLKVNRSKKANSFSDFDGKFQGHSDGIIKGLKESGKVHILEAKSCSDKKFKAFKEKGIETEPKYAAQAQLYAGYAGLDRIFFVLENKDTSERIQERVKFDKGRFDMLREKARLIIEAEVPPSGISDRPDWWACKFCALNNEQWCRRDWSSPHSF